MKKHISRRGGPMIGLLLAVIAVCSVAVATPASARVDAPAASAAAAHVGAAAEANTDHYRASTLCSSSVYLYDGDGYTGAALSTKIRWTYLNLPNYGFDNRTESVRTGACGVELYSGEWGSGAYLYIPPWTWYELDGGTWDNTTTSILVF